mgnify:CR=1 FL=1|tara:strand:+ start:3759 stop:4547 length:789 start_codon:yes stop_codon:yes gene_type:complete
MRRRFDYNNRVKSSGLGQPDSIHHLITAEDALEKIDNIGVTVAPGEPLSAIISSLGQLGGRIFLTEGTHAVVSTIEITTPVQIIGLTPGRTRITRLVDSTDPIIRVSSDKVKLENIRFTDTHQNSNLIEVYGDDCDINDCVFDSFKTAIHLGFNTGRTLSPTRTSITRCRFVEGKTTGVAGGDGKDIYSPAIYLNSTTEAIVAGNQLGEYASPSSTDTNVIETSASTTNSTFTMNVAPSWNIRYKGGSGNVNAGNVATVVTF